MPLQIDSGILESWVHKQSCFMNYLGVWMVEPSWIKCAVSSINNGTLKPIEARLHDDDEQKRSFAVIANGIAVIDINGPMMKGLPKIAGTSTVLVRQLLKLAINDPTVESILLLIDSPGGHVAGTQELAEAVFKANKIKSVFAHIDDLGGSAAFWVASQASRITANKTSEIGAIGAVAIINDTSKKFENEGIKVHVIASGPFKGDGADGVPITDEMLESMQMRVEDLNTHFLAAVASGRNLNAEQIKAVSDGRIFIADKALKLGLIDSIQSLDTTIAQISSEIEIKQRSREMSVRRADAELKFAKEF